MNICNDMAKALKQYRKDNGLSQAAMAKLLGCKQQNVSRFELGNIDPGIIWVQNMLEVIGYEIIIKTKGGKR